MNHSKTLYSTLHIGLVRYIHDSTIHKGHLCLYSKLKSWFAIVEIIMTKIVSLLI